MDSDNRATTHTRQARAQKLTITHAFNLRLSIRWSPLSLSRVDEPPRGGIISVAHNM